MAKKRKTRIRSSLVVLKPAFEITQKIENDIEDPNKWVLRAFEGCF